MKNLLLKFQNDESGATAIEYGLIAALIALAIVSGATMVGGQLDDMFKDIAGMLKAPEGEGG